MTQQLCVSAASPRFDHAVSLAADVCCLKYVSGAREEALHRLGIKSVEDLLLHIPYRYLDFCHVYTIEDAPVGDVVTVVAEVDRLQNKAHTRIPVTEVSLIDETGVINAVFFRQPWISRQLAVGDRLALIGKIEFSYGFKQMKSPHFEKLDSGQVAGSIQPVHYVSSGISVAWMRRIVSTAFEQLLPVADPIPAELRVVRGLMPRGQAYRAMHFPHTFGERDLARRRLAYDEALYLQLALRLRNDMNLLGVAPVAHISGEHTRALAAALPFKLSDEQQEAVDQITADMCSSERIMNRLLLGDVGTGKTAVASFGLALVADTGTQACVMAPTGVLAQQYSVKVGPLLSACGISWALLTGATPKSERADMLSRLASGELTVLFGTQAVIQDDVEFRALSLVVIDEQHRFGVGQRNALRSKGPGADLLVMTATPIPRTLALTVYGDLDVSIIRHRPVEGAGVSTRVITDNNRDLAYGAIRDALSRGERAYVVCPLVEPTDSVDDLESVPGTLREEDGSVRVPVPLHSVAEEAERLSYVFRDARIGILHGRLPSVEKDSIISAFRAGSIDILVSTTVIEVGVDVPAATVMVIENGERFGLATLHQLRGRVGRGGVPGTCFVVTHAAKSGARSASQDRLEALEKTDDGFELAELDLRLRHEGEILGLRQHGGVSLRFVDLDADTDLIEWANRDATELLRYAHDLVSVCTLPLRHEVIRRYGDIFKEVSGG